MGIYVKDRELMRARTQAGLDTLTKNARVDASHIALVGYCFGGVYRNRLFMAASTSVYSLYVNTQGVAGG